MLHQYTYIVYNQLSSPVETSLFNILLRSCITCTTHRLKLLSSTMPRKDPTMNSIKMPTLSLLWKILQNIFIKETNNYTKRILPSHIDHSLKSRGTNGKKLTTEEINTSIACHKPKQRKNKSRLLVRKIHHWIVLGSIIFPRYNSNQTWHVFTW